MAEQLFDPEILIPITAIVCVFIFVLVKTVVGILAQMFSVWRNTRLKERMLDRGLSVHEIERVCDAGVTRNSKSKKPPTYEDSCMAKTVSQPQLP
jgi:hypothetical protein